MLGVVQEMNQFWQNITIAAFSVILTATLSVAGFTYMKIIEINTRLSVIETLVHQHQKGNHATLRKEEPRTVATMRP
jgi:hypothetical protein